MSKSNPFPHVPGLGSWLKALALPFFCSLFIAIVKFSLAFLSVLDEALEAVWPWDSESLQVIQILLFFGCLVFVGIVIPIFAMSHLHQFLWADPDPKLPKWLPNKKSQIHGFNDWLVCAVTLAVLFVIVFIRYGFNLHIRGIVPPVITTQETQVFGVIFVIIAAHLYHFLEWLGKRNRPVSKKQEKKRDL